MLLALIGDRWLAAADEHGSRRLDDAEDFVRIEIEAALTRKVRIIPILVEGASMPSEDQLPASMAPLARRQALQLTPARFSADTGRLLRTLERALAEARAAEESAPSAGAPVGPEPPKAAEPLPDDSVTLRGRRTRPLVVTLALAGAGLGIISYVLPRSENDAYEYFDPETLGVPLLVAALAILLQAGRIRERLSYGLLLGFGLLTVAGAIGIWELSSQNGGTHDAWPVYHGAGALVLVAGLTGTAGVIRSPQAWGAPFRWGPASLLAVVGAMVAVTALFVRFGESDAGNPTKLIHLGAPYDLLTGVAYEPIVAIAVACVAAYALGKGGAARLLAAGLALALAAQIALFYGGLLLLVRDDYRGHWSSEHPAGFLVGFGAAALFAAAGLLGRRSP